MSNDDWKQDLDSFFGEKKSEELGEEKRSEQNMLKIKSFFDDVLKSAFAELKAEFEKHGRRVEYRISRRERFGTIRIWHGSDHELSYRVAIRGNSSPDVDYVGRDGQKGKVLLLSSGARTRHVSELSKRDVIDSVIERYKKSMG